TASASAPPLEFAAATSGKAVLVSGLTVLIAMAGMFIAGNAVFTRFAIGTMLVVPVAIIGRVTVLPAVLSKLGDNVERGRVPYISRLRHRNHGEARAWAFVIDKALKRPVLVVVTDAAVTRPVLAVLLSPGLLLTLAYPALDMRLINPGVAGLPHDLPIM